MLAVLLLAQLVAAAPERLVQVTAQRFRYSPSTIELKLGEPVVLELTALDRTHGFAAPELGIDVEVPKGLPVRVRIVPQKAGSFAFHCTVFCGSGHEQMQGLIVVRP